MARAPEGQIPSQARPGLRTTVEDTNPSMLGQAFTRKSSQPSQDPVLLFDDACGFCNASVQTVLRHEKKRTLRFASLHGEYGLAFRARHPELQAIDSMIWLRPGDGQDNEFVAIRSDAALLTADYLGGRFRIASVVRFIPKGIRDAVYDFVARHRHKLSPTAQECLIPTPEQRSRFFR